jgi:DNA polymerase-3 subunit epsilon
VGVLEGAITADPDDLVRPAVEAIARLAAQQRFEEAAVERDRARTLVRALARTQRLASFSALAEVVAARPGPTGGWDLAVVRHGRLAAAGHSSATEARATADALRAGAETVPAAPPPMPAASTEEAHVLLRWLEQPGTRLVEISRPWALPTRSALAVPDGMIALDVPPAA